MKNDLLGQILLKVESLPSMPKAGARVLALLKSPDTSVAEIEKVLRRDPGLTTNVLKLANSAYFGMPSKVGSVKQAFVLLGARQLSQLVLTTCTCALMDKSVEGYESPPGELWRHSIAVATIAEALVKYKKITDSNDVFTPALLHDIGKLVLGRYVKEEFETIRKIMATGVTQDIAENMVLGIDHAELGSQILSQWSFPQDVINAVRFHHNAEAIHNSSNQIDIVYLANLLFHSSTNSRTLKGQPVGLSPALINRLNIKPEQFEKLTEKVEPWIDKISKDLVSN